MGVIVVTGAANGIGNATALALAAQQAALVLTDEETARGLGKAVMSEGLRRAQRLGANLATVSSYSDGAHALYASMGFTEFDLLEPWIKEW